MSLLQTQLRCRKCGVDSLMAKAIPVAAREFIFLYWPGERKTCLHSDHNVSCAFIPGWIADAHRDGNRFIGRADEKLTGFIELERTRRCAPRKH
jgi:hypothetical protein